jgi:hypothetical protein
MVTTVEFETHDTGLGFLVCVADDDSMWLDSFGYAVLVSLSDEGEVSRRVRNMDGLEMFTYGVDEPEQIKVTPELIAEWVVKDSPELATDMLRTGSIRHWLIERINGHYRETHLSY